jgi:hypothetical protein
MNASGVKDGGRKAGRRERGNPETDENSSCHFRKGIYIRAVIRPVPWAGSRRSIGGAGGSLTYGGGVRAGRIRAGGLRQQCCCSQGRSRPDIPADRLVRPTTSGDVKASQIRLRCASAVAEASSFAKASTAAKAMVDKLEDGMADKTARQAGSNRIKANQGSLNPFQSRLNPLESHFKPMGRCWCAGPCAEAVRFCRPAPSGTMAGQGAKNTTTAACQPAN